MLQMIEDDILGRNEEITVEIKQKVADARVTIILGLGDKPLKLCLPVKNDPFKMWARLKEKYDIANTAMKV